MAESLYGAGLYGVGLYSADPLQDAAVLFSIPFDLSGDAAFGVIANAAVSLGIPVDLEGSAGAVAVGTVVWAVPVLLADAASSVVVFGDIDLSFEVRLNAGENVYGGLYWNAEVPQDQLWTPVPTDSTIWTPISAPQV